MNCTYECFLSPLKHQFFCNNYDQFNILDLWTGLWITERHAIELYKNDKLKTVRRVNLSQ